MIPDDVLEEVRARADIVQLVGEHVPLKRAGKEYKALCPFHDEKTPSFYVVPDKGFYKCFGCGESGDLFSFLMNHGGLDFQEAVRTVAGRVGVDIPDQRRDPERDRHRSLYEAVAFAADFYARTLWDGEAGARARDYLEARGIGRDAAERFRLGCARDEWQALREAAHRHGIEDDVLLEAGLIKTSERADEPYDRLRNRLVFPITTASGRVVGFGGRALGRAREKVPKYLNSPETPIYHKGRVLYGLHWAKAAIRREETALVVEGYMDYVSLAARGLEHVVAPLGTALTAEQASLLGRYTGSAHLLYDSDRAGLRATFKSADALLAAKVHPLVVTLPEAEDPDSLVRDGGAEALRPHLDAAVDVLDRKIELLEERGYFERIDGARKALDGLLPTLRAAADAVLRDIYIDRAVKRTGVRRETLERELAERGPGQGGAGGGRQSRREPRREEVRRGERSSGRAARPGLAGQRQLLLLLLRDEERIPDAAEALESEEFTDPVYRELFDAVVRSGESGDDGADALDVSGDARERLEALLGDRRDLANADRVYRDSVNDIRLEALYIRMDETRRQVDDAKDSEDEAKLERLMSEIGELAKRAAEIAPPGERLARQTGRVYSGNQD